MSERVLRFGRVYYRPGTREIRSKRRPLGRLSETPAKMLDVLIDGCKKEFTYEQITKGMRIRASDESIRQYVLAIRRAFKNDEILISSVKTLRLAHGCDEFEDVPAAPDHSELPLRQNLESSLRTYLDERLPSLKEDIAQMVSKSIWISLRNELPVVFTTLAVQILGAYGRSYLPPDLPGSALERFAKGESIDVIAQTLGGTPESIRERMRSVVEQILNEAAGAGQQ